MEKMYTPDQMFDYELIIMQMIEIDKKKDIKIKKLKKQIEKQKNNNGMGFFGDSIKKQ